MRNFCVALGHTFKSNSKSVVLVMAMRLTIYTYELYLNILMRILIQLKEQALLSSNSNITTVEYLISFVQSSLSSFLLT